MPPTDHAMSADAGQLIGHMIEEYRMLRSEITDAQREYRAEIERVREGHRSELGSIYKLIAGLDIKITERNAERRTEHRELAQKVTLYAAAVSMAAATLMSAVANFFFR